MNHLNFKTSLTIITVILCSVILWGCSAQNAPSKTELKKDLSLNDTVVAGINGSEKFSVEDINITLADSNDDIYKAEITVYLKNSIYTAQKGVSVTYNHYDTGGWKLEELAASNATNINVLSGHPETAAIKTARESYEHAIITDRKTDLKTKQYNKKLHKNILKELEISQNNLENYIENLLDKIIVVENESEVNLKIILAGGNIINHGSASKLRQISSLKQNKVADLNSTTFCITLLYGASRLSVENSYNREKNQPLCHSHAHS